MPSQPRQGKLDTLTYTQISLWLFIVFTIYQLIFFIFIPRLYLILLSSLDYAPKYPSLRLIGIKEVGLMTLYSMIASSGDTKLAWMTVYGRLTVIPFMVYLIYIIGAPKTLVFGVVQDVAGAALTYWSLREDLKRYKVKRKLGNVFNNEQMIRAAIFLGGIYEITFGLGMFFYPQSYTRYPLIPFEWTIAPFHIGIRTVGMIYVPSGLYQAYISLVRGLPSVYRAIAYQHVSFFMLAMLLGYFLNTGGQRIHPPFIPLLIGIVVFILDFGNDSPTKGDKTPRVSIKKMV